MKRLLLLDLTPFYGGGQKFIQNIYCNSNHEGDYHFIVANEKLFDELDTENKLLLPPVLGVLSILKKVNTYISEHSIQYVLLNGNRPIYFAPFIKCNFKIGYRHTSNNAFKGLKRPVGSLLLNLSLLFCNKVVLLYKAALQEVWQKNKAVIIPNGIEIKQGVIKPMLDKEQVIITCISRLDADKGIDWLCKVYNSTFNDHPNVILKIAGEGEFRGEIEKLIRPYKGNIELLGFVKDINSLLNITDVFVLPSQYESFPLSILEAMAHGLPVISTDTGGVSEMIENSVNGMLINYGDDVKLADAMRSFVFERENRFIMGKNSLIAVQEFSIQKCVEKIEEIIRDGE